MGMYTELVMAVELRKDISRDVIDILERMCDARLEIPKVLPDHPLFKTDRWEMLLCCDSYYFAGDTNSTIRLDSISRSHYLTIRTNLKNYRSEIELFLDWIAQYVDDPKDECAGYFRYEEDRFPTLIYFDYMDNEGNYYPVALMNICEGDQCGVTSLERTLEYMTSWIEWKAAKGE